MGDGLRVGKQSRVVTRHPGQLSLAIPPRGCAMSTGDSYGHLLAILGWSRQRCRGYNRGFLRVSLAGMHQRYFSHDFSVSVSVIVSEFFFYFFQFSYSHSYYFQFLLQLLIFPISVTVNLYQIGVSTRKQQQ